MTELLTGYCGCCGGLEPLAQRVGMSRDTLRRRLRDPDTFTVRELKLIARKTQMSLDEVFAAAKGEGK